MNLKNYLLLAILSLGASSAFAAAPTISGFSPASGVLSSTVTITGTNFISPATVSFNGVASTLVSVSSSTTIHATVPTTASTGTITVTDSGGSASSASAFTVLPGMAATPATVGPPTTALTLYYSGFSAREAVDFYFDASDIALSAASTSGAGNIAITIPAVARPGSHWITAVGRHSASAVQIPFTVRASWPQFGFQPNHRSKNRYENVLSPATVGILDEAWRTPFISSVLGAPVVVNGVVYAACGDNTIRAFDEITGAQKWAYTTGGNAGYSSPAVSNGIVYVGSADSYLYALDAVTGALKWRYKTGGQVNSSPNVVNGIVYFGSYDNSVYALNATTGALVWSYATGGLIFSSPLVANGAVYVGSEDKSVYALNAATGAEIWNDPAPVGPGAILSSPVIAGGFIYIGTLNGTVYALTADTGTEEWTYSIGGSGINGALAEAGGSLFFGCANGTVYSLSSSGTLRWSTAISSSGGGYGSVCLANGVVYATDGSYTYALDENTGALLTTLPVGSAYGGPIVVNGALFAGDEADGVLARYTPYALPSNYLAPRPDPKQLHQRPLR